MAVVPTLAELRSGGKPALARVLALAEARASDAAVVALLDAAYAAPRGRVVGLTGTPGVGKSTLASALIARARARRETVGVVAVDPSSRRTKGALLGDRARIVADPEDEGVFVRSLAARDRLGGLSPLAVAAMVAMRAVHDLVIVESVGVGQSEADISYACDTVVLCVQPGSGDALQFMKAGVMEAPDVVAITKADLGALATRARADVEGALSLAARAVGEAPVPVVLLSALNETGLDALEAAIITHQAASAAALSERRAAQGAQWLADAVKDAHGRAGLSRLSTLALPEPGGAPFAAIGAALAALSRHQG